MNEELIKLSHLIKEVNETNRMISGIINRPAQIGHVGEFIASQIFDIELDESASRKAIDGHFRSGRLAGKSVNIKWYGKLEGLLDITPKSLPDYYLVLAGPKSAATSSRGKVRPWLIDYVYLFDAEDLVERLKIRGVKIGIATSVAKQYWREAEIYQIQRNFSFEINDGMKSELALFGSD